MWGTADLWVAYTQKSFWQIYNAEYSRPFREINYEPELILNFPVNFKLFGFKTRMVGIAFNHLSNGKSGDGNEYARPYAGSEPGAGESRGG